MIPVVRRGKAPGEDERVMGSWGSVAWRPVTTVAAASASLAFGVWAVWWAVSSDGWTPPDYVNLVFHEAGHVVFRVFGETIALYGGTLLQLLVPLAVSFSFMGRGDAIGVGCAGMWFFQNFLNIARYMADARAGRLPLVGGGLHDWVEIFHAWGILRHDTAIAAWVAAAGWLGMFLCLGWLWRRALRRDGM